MERVVLCCQAWRGGIFESVLLSVVGEEGIKGYAERCESVGGRGLAVRLFVRYVRRERGREWLTVLC